jgi:hypothetical protein
MSRLQELAHRPRTEPARPEERCELCAEPIAPEHRHVLDLTERRPLCVCRACSILFDRDGAGGGHYRLIPDRCRLVEDFDLDDAFWLALHIPVDMAFFFESSVAGRVVAFYPSPLGATESLLELDAWTDLVERNPILETLEPDVEALLVNRARGERQHWLLPVDRCYELVGLIRQRWRGFTGGNEVWETIDGFFADLGRRAETVTRDGKEATWRRSSATSESVRPT